VQRRTFLTLPVGATLLQAQTPPANQQRAIIELRYFHLRSGRQVQRTTDYLQHGWVPAAERAGVRPVGCFNAVIAPDTPFVLTLASYPSLAALETAREKLSADKELQAAADEYNSLTELSYIRMESSLLWAFPSFPAVTPPPVGENRASYIFELRTYESPNEKGQARKIKMFGDGEFGIFRRLNMLPVFAGQTIVGTHMPSLTYMLAFPDLAARDKGWTAFSADPEWQKLRTVPGMADADLVSNISNAIVRPLPFSPIR
jgi:hypothetical protein